MDFKTSIIDKLEKKSYDYDQRYILILNNIIFTLCLRLMLIITQLTNHCHQKLIKRDTLNYALQIELPHLKYTKETNLPHFSIHNLALVFESKITSTLPITKTCLTDLSKILNFLIDYFIIKSVKNKQMNISLLLNILKKNNLFLYRFIVNSFNLKGYTTSFF